MKLIHGDCLEELKKLGDSSVDCVVTSPPYWALRLYGDSEKELGQEKTVQEYISNLINIFNEVKRVLKDGGTCWVNLGDTYGTQSGGLREGKFGKNTNAQKLTQPKSVHKCLCQIPSRFAIAMTDNGWILRNEIIWYKRSCMPESVKDRFTVDYEKIFFFVKSKKYYFEQQFEDTKTIDNYVRDRDNTKLNNTPGRSRMGGLKTNHYTKRNMRCVWDVTTKPSPIKHYAMYPQTLVERMIKSGCPEKGIVLDPFMGAGNTLICAKKLIRDGIGIELYGNYFEMAEKRIRETSTLFGGINDYR